MASIRSARAGVRKGDKVALEEELEKAKDKVVFVNTKDRMERTLYILAVDTLIKTAKESEYEDPGEECKPYTDIILLLKTYADKSIKRRLHQTTVHSIILDLLPYIRQSWLYEFLDHLISDEDVDEGQLLHLFIGHRLWDYVALLCARPGVDVCTLDIRHHTALSLAVRYEDAPREVIKGLIHPTIINMIDGVGDTPLHAAALHGCQSFIEELLEAGANVNVLKTRNVKYLPIDAYFMVNIKKLNPDLVLKLLPKDKYHLSKVLAYTVALWTTNRPESSGNVKTILHSLMLHMEFSRWNILEYKLSQNNARMFGVNEYPGIYDVMVNGESIIPTRYGFNLNELLMMTHCLTSCGFIIDKIPDALTIDEAEDPPIHAMPASALIDKTTLINSINAMWEAYNPPRYLSLFALCCRVVRSCVVPLTHENIEALPVPSLLHAKISRSDLALGLYQKLQSRMGLN